MILGDVYQKGVETITSGNYFDIQPAEDHEIVIHNICSDGACELYVYDGTNELLLDILEEAGSWSAQYFHCTNGKRIRVKNNGVADIKIYADGVYTKVA